MGILTVMLSDPFLLPDHVDYNEVLTDAAVHILATGGVAEFSVSRMARWMKVSPQALLGAYSRSRAIEVVVICFARRWLRWSLGGASWYLDQERTDAGDRWPCPLRLPRTEEERHGVRVLHALAELAEGERVRGNPVPAQHLADLRRDETELLRSRVAGLASADIYAPVPELELQGLVALLSGLRRRLVEDPAQVSWEQGCRLFAQAVSAVAGSGRDAPTTTPELPPPHEPAA